MEIKTQYSGNIFDQIVSSKTSNPVNCADANSLSCSNEKLVGQPKEDTFVPQNQDAKSGEIIEAEAVDNIQCEDVADSEKTIDESPTEEEPKKLSLKDKIKNFFKNLFKSKKNEAVSEEPIKSINSEPNVEKPQMNVMHSSGGGTN